ncbi:hypothetical protein SIN8267_00627 [Sinobacterium norvegicum]|uniref:Laminin G domain-containing protein n=1 Tax=Sinobacterium norvegicum TaxID=1641715 RepID=A0ABN8EFP2_9GAMM|nr:DUF4347 domain-containing protein [Sinobacterium norvegicum]CAH0990535.1 hypothetical protein SIN8267_00627 [Sinobacterium norvegicum]
MAVNTSEEPAVIEIFDQRLLYSATIDVVVIDSGLTDYQLLEQAAAEADYLLAYDGQQQSLDSIVEQLRQWTADTEQKIDTLSIVSHGSNGGIELGENGLNSSTLEQSSSALYTLQQLMRPEGEIALYGCDVASGQGGRDFVDQLAALTQTTVYASDDTTGFGGDWLLEYSSDSERDHPHVIDAAGLSAMTTSLAKTAKTYAGNHDDGWLNGDNILADNNAVAIGAEGEVLILSGFDFQLDGRSHINGIKIKVEGESLVKRTELSFELSSDGGASWTTAETTEWLAGIGFDTDTIGQSEDFLWGRDWTAVDFDPADFQIRVTAVNVGESWEHNKSAEINYISARVFYTEQTAPVAVSSTTVTIEDRLTPIILQGLEPDNGDALEAYRIESLPLNGVLIHQSQEVSTGDLFTAAQIASGELQFLADAQWSGSTGFDFSVFDGDDWSAQGTTHQVTVASVDDAPSLFVPENQWIGLNSDLIFSAANGNAIMVVDPDTDDAFMTLTVDSGVLTLADTAGLSFSVGDGDNDATMSFSGSLIDINVALEGLAFIADNGSAAQLNIVVGSTSTILTASFETTLESVEFSNHDLLNSGAQHVEDPLDAGNKVIQTSDFNNPNTVAIASEVFDQQRDVFSVAFAVNTVDAGTAFEWNSPYLIGADGSLSNQGSLGLWLNTNGEVVLRSNFNDDNLLATNTATGIKINDGQWHHIVISNDADQLRVFIDGIERASVASGDTMLVRDIAVGGLQGGASASQGVAAYFDSLQVFSAALSASEVLAMSSDDNSNKGVLFASEQLTITPAADVLPPVLVNQSLLVANNHTTVIGSGDLQAQDLLSNDSELLYTITSSPGHGQLMLSGIALLNGDNFSQDDINKGLLTYSHSGDSGGADAVVFSVQDNDGNTSSGEVLAITVSHVNDSPINHLPSSAVVMLQNSTVMFTDDYQLSVADNTVGTGLLSIELTVEQGQLTLSMPLSGSITLLQGDVTGDTVLKFTGTVSDINSTLAAMRFTPTTDYLGDQAKLTITTIDFDNSLNHPILDTGSNIVAKYNFENTVLADVTGTQANAIAVNGAAIVNDSDRGQVVSLDGVTQYIEIPSTATEMLSSFTVSFWLKSQQLTMADDYQSNPTLFGASNNGVGNNDFSITTENGYLAVFHGLNGAIDEKVVTNIAVADDAWHMISVSNDGSVLRLYVDGQLVTDAQGDTVELSTGNSILIDADQASNQQFYLGAQSTENINDRVMKSPHQGLYDDLRIYNTALNAQDITTLYSGYFATDSFNMAVDTAPVVQPGSSSVLADVVLTAQLPTATDGDGNLNPLGYQLAALFDNNAGNGQLLVNSDGSFEFDPANDFDYLAVGESVEVSFRFTASDNFGFVSDSQLMTITVVGVNESPQVGVETLVTTDQNTILQDQQLPAAIDIDGDPMTYQLLHTVSQGSLSLSDNGVFNFDPQQQFNGLTAGETGQVQFQYQVVDSQGGVSEAQTVTIMIEGLDDTAVVSGVFSATISLDNLDNIAMLSADIAIEDIDVRHTPLFFDSEAEGLFGRFTLVNNQWQYQVSAELVDGMAAGSQVEERFVVTASDGQQRDIVITLLATESLSWPSAEEEIAGSATDDEVGIRVEDSQSDESNQSDNFVPPDTTGQGGALAPGPISETVAGVDAAVASDGQAALAATDEPVSEHAEILSDDGLIPSLKALLSLDSIVIPVTELAGFESLTDDDIAAVVVTSRELDVLLQNVEKQRLTGFLSGDGEAIDSHLLWQSLNVFEDELRQSQVDDKQVLLNVKAIGMGVMSLASAWLLRAAAIGSSLAAVLPVWSSFDPVAVLKQKNTDNSLSDIEEEEDDVDQFFAK